MSQVYIMNNQRQMVAVNGEVIQDESVNLECNDGLCILTTSTNPNSLIKTLEKDFPLSTLRSNSLSKKSKKAKKAKKGKKGNQWTRSKKSKKGKKGK